MRINKPICQGKDVNRSEFSRILMREVNMDYEEELLGLKISLNDKWNRVDKR